MESGPKISGIGKKVFAREEMVISRIIFFFFLSKILEFLIISHLSFYFCREKGVRDNFETELEKV